MRKIVSFIIVTTYLFINNAYPSSLRIPVKVDGRHKQAAKNELLRKSLDKHIHCLYQTHAATKEEAEWVIEKIAPVVSRAKSKDRKIIWIMEFAGLSLQQIKELFKIDNKTLRIILLRDEKRSRGIYKGVVKLRKQRLMMLKRQDMFEKLDERTGILASYFLENDIQPIHEPLDFDSWRRTTLLDTYIHKIPEVFPGNFDVYEKTFEKATKEMHEAGVVTRDKRLREFIKRIKRRHPEAYIITLRGTMHRYMHKPLSEKGHEVNAIVNEDALSDFRFEYRILDNWLTEGRNNFNEQDLLDLAYDGARPCILSILKTTGMHDITIEKLTEDIIKRLSYEDVKDLSNNVLYNFQTTDSSYLMLRLYKWLKKHNKIEEKEIKKLSEYSYVIKKLLDNSKVSYETYDAAGSQQGYTYCIYKNKTSSVGKDGLWLLAKIDPIVSEVREKGREVVLVTELDGVLDLYNVKKELKSEDNDDAIRLIEEGSASVQKIYKLDNGLREADRISLETNKGTNDFNYVLTILAQYAADNKIKVYAEDMPFDTWCQKKLLDFSMQSTLLFDLGFDKYMEAEEDNMRKRLELFRLKDRDARSTIEKIRALHPDAYIITDKSGVYKNMHEELVKKGHRVVTVTDRATIKKPNSVYDKILSRWLAKQNPSLNQRDRLDLAQASIEELLSSFLLYRISSYSAEPLSKDIASRFTSIKEIRTFVEFVLKVKETHAYAEDQLHHQFLKPAVKNWLTDREKLEENEIKYLASMENLSKMMAYLGDTQLQSTHFEDLSLLFAPDGLVKKFTSYLKEERGKTSFQQILQKAAENDIFGISTPIEYGGSGFSHYYTYRIAEEIARYSPSLAVTMLVNATVQDGINRFGTDKQKKELLPGLASKGIGAIAITEPGAGSDAMAITTSAENDGDFYILNGEKIFISSVDIASVYLVFAVTDDAGGNRKKKKITAFLVDSNTPGLSIGKPEMKLGQKDSPTGSLSFGYCRVPKENILGELDHGTDIWNYIIPGGRIGIAYLQQGIAKAAYKDAFIHATKQRKQFGKLIAAFQEPKDMLRKMQFYIAASDLVLGCAAYLKDHSQDSAAIEFFASIAKLLLSEEGNKIARDALQLFGGSGYMLEYPLAGYMQDSVVTKIYEGTSQIQKLIIKRHILSFLGADIDAENSIYSYLQNSPAVSDYQGTINRINAVMDDAEAKLYMAILDERANYHDSDLLADLVITRLMLFKAIFLANQKDAKPGTVKKAFRDTSLASKFLGLRLAEYEIFALPENAQRKTASDL